MALTCQQVTVATSSGLLCVIPPGECTVTITNSNVTAANVIYVGTGTATVNTVTSSNGAPISSQQSVTLFFPPGNSGASLYAIGVASTKAGIFICTAQ